MQLKKVVFKTDIVIHFLEIKQNVLDGLCGMRADHSKGRYHKTTKGKNIDKLLMF